MPNSIEPNFSDGGGQHPINSPPNSQRDNRLLPVILTKNMSLPKNPIIGFPSVHSRGKQIGEGSEGAVETWAHNPTGTVMAVKVVYPGKKLPIEVEIMNYLPHHDSIVRFFGFVPNLSNFAGDSIFSEYCPIGDLFELMYLAYIQAQTWFTEAFMWAVFSQLTSALAFLHEGVGRPNTNSRIPWRAVIHRDIKVENIFIRSIGPKRDCSRLVLKLGDFGLSTFYDPSDAMMPMHWGTTVYWPPEQTWMNRNATPAGDVWAVGALLHEFAHGFPPVVDPEVTYQLAVKEKRATVPKDWTMSMRLGYWEAETPRKPVPINVDLEQQPHDRRRRRPTPKYSDALNDALMRALAMQVADRATAKELKVETEVKYAAILEEQLRRESEGLGEEQEGSVGKEEWFMAELEWHADENM